MCWYHALKFLKKVKTDDTLRQELCDFSKNNKIEKPKTSVVVVKKTPLVNKSRTGNKGLSLGLSLGNKAKYKPKFTLSHGIDKPAAEDKEFPERPITLDHGIEEDKGFCNLEFKTEP